MQYDDGAHGDGTAKSTELDVKPAGFHSRTKCLRMKCFILAFYGLATIDVEMHVMVLDKRYGIIKECALPPVSHPAGVSIKARD